MAAHGVKVAISTGNTDNNANILERAPWNNGVVEEVEEEEIVEEEEVEDEEE